MRSGRSGIKLELYRVFQEVADQKSVSGAAKVLYISQSAVSQSIKQLEEQLGVRLFIRGTRGVTLTSEGHTLYEYVHNAISLIENGEDKIAQTKALELGELSIGASDTITSCFLLEYLDAFHSLYPHVRLRVLNGTSPEVVELLKAGRVDVAFANLPMDGDSLVIQKCFDIQDVFVASAQYEIDFDRTYTPAELAKFPLILLERKANTRHYVDSYFIHNGAPATPEIELGSHDLLLKLTKIGLGVSFVIREFARAYLDDGQIRELKVDPPVPKRGVGMCFLKNVTPSAACQKFLELIGHASPPAGS